VLRAEHFGPLQVAVVDSCVLSPPVWHTMLRPNGKVGFTMVVFAIRHYWVFIFKLVRHALNKLTDADRELITAIGKLSNNVLALMYFTITL
jgi:hypothetical protein